MSYRDLDTPGLELTWGQVAPSAPSAVMICTPCPFGTPRTFSASLVTKGNQELFNECILLPFIPDTELRVKPCTKFYFESTAVGSRSHLLGLLVYNIALTHLIDVT